MIDLFFIEAQTNYDAAVLKIEKTFNQDRPTMDKDGFEIFEVPGEALFF
jgi:hypothetical protein